MKLSPESKIVCGILLIAIPTIMYGGLILLGVLTDGVLGRTPGNMELNETQKSLWRAGHAHAGVLVILSLILQPLVDNTGFSNRAKWLARICAPIASFVLPIGFFGVAFFLGFKWLIYIGFMLLLFSLLLTGVGLMRNLKENTG